MKKCISLLLVVALISVLIPTSALGAEATGDVTLRIHYHRFDNNYEGWNLWLWPEGGAGVAYTFDETDDYGVIAQVTLENSEEVSKVGIIVRLREWEAKDIEIDRFIDVSTRGEDGVVDVYLIQGDSNIMYSLDEVDLSPTFLSATLSGAERVNVSVTVPFSLEDAKDTFLIRTESGIEIKAKNVFSDQSGDTVSSATVVFTKELPIGEVYYLSKVDYGEIIIDMSKAFDMPNFNESYYYDGNDLGANYSLVKTDFRLWAPTAMGVDLLLYKEGIEKEPYETITMTKDVQGTYIASVEGDLNGVFYTYNVNVNGSENQAVDPYAKAVGVNGDRAMVINLSETNPQGWENDKRPDFESFNDAIIYELHLRDLSMSDTSGIENKGKYLGLTELGTTNEQGLSTGLDHIKELGITHLQLLPVFDYRSINETTLENNDFNWGYDPKNYNVPEGSYSTDPFDGQKRIIEFKTMVKTLHDNDLRVVMDVVYNHTGASQDSSLNLIVPNYYYRTENGKFSNGSGCGNETASEREMVRKMIVDSVVFWASEYHIDGFRFDLMGLHDLETMEAVRKALDAVDPTIIIYGEGWTGGGTPLAEGKRAVKINTFLLQGIGAFSDDLRDGIKGHVFESETPGFINGAQNMEESVKFGIVGATSHTQVDYKEVNYSEFPWADSPAQSINYAEAHDNLTLWDKLLVTNPNASKEELVYMDKMGAAIFLTSQGVPFIHAGMEFLRTKDGVDNSYQSPDSVNMLDWSMKSENIDVFEYYKGLIALRKAHPAFRMTSAKDIQDNLIFYGRDESYGILQLPATNMVGYLINNNANNDEAGSIIVLFNSNLEEQSIPLPEGTWTILVDKNQVNLEGIKTIVTPEIIIGPQESLILTSPTPSSLTKISPTEPKVTQPSTSTPEPLTTPTPTQKKFPNLLPLALASIATLTALTLFTIHHKKKKKQ